MRPVRPLSKWMQSDGAHDLEHTVMRETLSLQNPPIP